VREIKFRAWWPNLKYMGYQDHNDYSCVGRNYELSVGNIVVPMYDGDYTLMQYTGLKDKNGREIYEGDIVTAPWHWEEPHAIELPEDYYSFMEFGISDKMTIVGNIYENSELLR